MSWSSSESISEDVLVVIVNKYLDPLSMVAFGETSPEHKKLVDRAFKNKKHLICDQVLTQQQSSDLLFRCGAGLETFRLEGLYHRKAIIEIGNSLNHELVKELARRF